MAFIFPDSNLRAWPGWPPEPFQPRALSFRGQPSLPRPHRSLEGYTALWLLAGFALARLLLPRTVEVSGLEGLVLETAAGPWGPGQGCSLHPAFAEGSWGPEERFSLQAAATAASGPSTAMASCSDSDNSWVLAGSEVGTAGLGTPGREVPVGLGCSWVCALPWCLRSPASPPAGC